MRVREIFDKSDDFNVTASPGKGYTYRTAIGDDEENLTKITFGAGKVKDSWNVVFEVNGRYDVVDSKGMQVQIFSKVINMLRHFIENEQPESITFTSKTYEPSRSKLYDRMIRVLGREYNYSLAGPVKRDGTSQVYKVQRDS